jgi:integrase
MASYRKRTKTWAYRYSVKVNGKRKERGQGGFATYEQAVMGYQEEHEPDKIEIKSKNALFNYCKEYYLEQNRMGKTTDKTAHDYIRTLENHVKDDVIGSLNIKHIQAETIDEYYDRLITGTLLLKSGKTKEKNRIRNKTIQRIHRTLRAPLNHAVRYKHISANPFLVARVPSSTNVTYDTLNIKELLYFFDKLKDVDELIVRSFIMLSALIGTRRSEMASLEWRDIDFINEQIIIRKSMSKQPTQYANIPTPKGLKHIHAIKGTKTNRERRIPMSEEAKIVLLDLREYHDKLEAIHPKWKTMIKMYSVDGDRRLAEPEVRDFIFRKEDGGYLHPDYMTKSFKKYAKLIFPYKNLRLHDLRHSFATNMLKANYPMHEIQVLIGHARISTTVDRYGHLSADDCRESVNGYNSLLHAALEKKKAE